MNASKENAADALKRLQNSAKLPNGSSNLTQQDCDFITLFLEAANRKLPTEKAYAADKKRGKAKSTKPKKKLAKA